MSISDQFTELQQSGKTPVCLFPKRKACERFNVQMLKTIMSQVHELDCIDEIHDTAGSQNFTSLVFTSPLASRLAFTLFTYPSTTSEVGWANLYLSLELRWPHGISQRLHFFRVGSVCGPSCSLFLIRLGSIPISGCSLFIRLGSI